jgi:hypothetical protein
MSVMIISTCLKGLCFVLPVVATVCRVRANHISPLPSPADAVQPVCNGCPYVCSRSCHKCKPLALHCIAKSSTPVWIAITPV